MKYLHIPVLLDEVSTACAQVGHAPFSYLDCTLGCGGHARFLLEKHSIDHFVGVDRDAQVLKEAQNNLKDFLPAKSEIIHSDFASFAQQKVTERQQFDFILVDLGISSFQIDNEVRGFSFRFENAFLDMRMDETDSITAADLINRSSEKTLREIFCMGEIPRPHKLAKAICMFRAKKPIRTVKDLLDASKHCLDKNRKGNPATLLFQALRVTVNQELKQLEMILEMLPKLLSSKGVVAILAFHSLEDRKVKHFLRSQAQEGAFALLHKKAVTASQEERRKNPRSRSAKLRIAQCL